MHIHLDNIIFLYFFSPSPAPVVEEPPAEVVEPPPPEPEADDNPGLSDPLDLYIDGVDNIPDSATIVKVQIKTVRLVQNVSSNWLPEIPVYL